MGGPYGKDKFTGDNIVVECDNGYSLNPESPGPVVCDESGQWQSSITCAGKQIVNTFIFNISFRCGKKIAKLVCLYKAVQLYCIY